MTDRALNRIVALDAATGALSRIVLENEPLLDEPVALTRGPGGDVLVASLQSNQVLRVNPQTGAATSYLTLPAGVAPGGLLFEPGSGDLFVSQFLDVSSGNQVPGDSVFRYDSTTALVQTFSTEGGPTGRTGMTFDAAGDLYVSAFTADTAGNGVVLKYDASSGYSPLGAFALGADVPGGAVGFNGLAFDEAGDLFVAALFSQKFVKFDVEAGAVVDQTVHAEPIAYPSGAIAGNDGALIVTSLGNNNPADPIYGNFLFPGTVLRVDPATGEAKRLLTGDYDGSAAVDGEDFLHWQRLSGLIGDISEFQTGFGNESVVGDFLPTGVIYYDAGSASAAAAPVPEPAAWALATSAAAAGWRVRRRRAV